MDNFDFLDSSNIGKEYNGFLLLKIDDIVDYEAKGVFLRHKRTGLEVYHIVKNDKENLFAFAFRTISKDSKGTAHIMEHSTLCGSEKYPLKEPFNTLAGQSLSTFINAMTYPDKTVYPAASVVRNDYFNMMDVYADCVFFPKLEKITFDQEAHRLELDEEGKLSIQGVVYNEMKGNFSSFNDVAYRELIGSMYPESYPSYCSGGDPLNIPELTYEQFLDFHQKFYNPDNCILFLYGDIPTGEQLDFLNEKYMSRIEKKYNCVKDVPYAEQKTPHVKDEVKALLELKLNESSKTFEAIAPVTGSTGNLVALSFYSGKPEMEKYYLSEVICGNDSTPLNKALKNSGLCDEPFVENVGQYQEEFWTFGMMGVKEGDEEKVFKLFEKEIDKLYKNGVSQKDIDSAVMGIDFALREKNRYWGPFGLMLMDKGLKGWVWGEGVETQLTPITSFQKVKEQIKADKDYTKNLIKKYFIDNKNSYKMIVRPSDKYFTDRAALEQKQIESFSQNLDKEELQKSLDKLHEYQQHVETPEELACMPHTKLSELDKNIDCATINLQFVKGSDNTDIPLFVSEEDTSGIFYIDIFFPFDNLEPKYFQHVPFLSNLITNLGWNNKPWDKCIQDSACIMGDVWGRILVGSVYDVQECKAFEQKYKEYNFCGRKWMGICCKALTSKAKETLEMLSEIVTKMDFKDTKRFKTLLREAKADKKAGLVRNGRDIALKRTTATWSEGHALSEILWGMSQLYTFADYKEKNAAEILKTFEYIYNESRKTGGILHVTADKKSLETILPMMETFAKASELTKLKPSKNYKLEDFLPYVKNAENAQGKETAESIKLETQTGYAAATYPCSKYLTKEAAAETVYTNWLCGHAFWDKFRTTGGCYGADIWNDAGEQCLHMATYRDPNPEKHVDVFAEILQSDDATQISDEDVEKSIVCVYGSAIIPQTPQDRGRNAFEQFLYGTYGLKQRRVENILSVTPEEVKKAAKDIKELSKQECHKVVFCDKSKKFYGKNLEIPL